MGAGPGFAVARGRFSLPVDEAWTALARVAAGSAPSRALGGHGTKASVSGADPLTLSSS